MIIDVHGHYTTAPPALGQWREQQLAAFDNGTTPPSPDALQISDADIRQTIEANQLAMMRDRGIDLTVFSPRASHMAHHQGDARVSATWARICNDLCHRVSSLFPDEFVGAAMLPQSPGEPIEDSLGELRRCVEELGFVGANLNPDPSGGRWSSPALTDRYWYPLYETLCELEIPAMIHVSTSCIPAVHTTGAYYLGADTTAFMQLLQGDLFRDFPDLRLIIPHGGGAVPYHWGRFRGLAQSLGRPEPSEYLMHNVFFDTCVYHQAGIDLLTQVIDSDNLLFASEAIGAVRGTDPLTGHGFDDTARYVAATAHLDADQRTSVYADNALQVFPRLARKLSPGDDLTTSSRNPNPGRESSHV